MPTFNPTMQQINEAQSLINLALAYFATNGRCSDEEAGAVMHFITDMMIDYIGTHPNMPKDETVIA